MAAFKLLDAFDAVCECLGDFGVFRSAFAGRGVHFRDYASRTSSTGQVSKTCRADLPMNSGGVMLICVLVQRSSTRLSMARRHTVGTRTVDRTAVNLFVNCSTWRFKNSCKYLKKYVKMLQDAWVHQMLMGGGKTCVVSRGRDRPDCAASMTRQSCACVCVRAFMIINACKCWGYLDLLGLICFDGTGIHSDSPLPMMILYIIHVLN